MDFDFSQNGADVNVTDNWGVTPMYLAASSGQLEVIQYLITAGARLSFRNLVRSVLVKCKEITLVLLSFALN